MHPSSDQNEKRKKKVNLAVMRVSKDCASVAGGDTFSVFESHIKGHIHAKRYV